MSILFNGIRTTGKIPLVIDTKGVYIDVLINKKKFKMAIDTAFNYILIDNKILSNINSKINKIENNKLGYIGYVELKNLQIGELELDAESYVYQGDFFAKSGIDGIIGGQLVNYIFSFNFKNKLFEMLYFSETKKNDIKKHLTEMKIRNLNKLASEVNSRRIRVMCYSKNIGILNLVLDTGSGITLIKDYDNKLIKIPGILVMHTMAGSCEVSRSVMDLKIINSHEMKIVANIITDKELMNKLGIIKENGLLGLDMLHNKHLIVDNCNYEVYIGDV